MIFTRTVGSSIIQSISKKLDYKLKGTSGLAAMTLASYGLSRKMATSSQLSHKTKHVLVVEDEDLIRETVADALRQETYKVSTAANGKEAVEFLEELAQQDYATLPLNLLILDLMLPHVSELEICRFLRSRGSDIPILILSAKGSETDRVVGLEVGVPLQRL